MFHNFLKLNTKHKTARSVTFSKLVFNCTILAHSCVEDFSVVLWPFNAQNLQCCKCYLSKSQNISPPKDAWCRAPRWYRWSGNRPLQRCQKPCQERPSGFSADFLCNSSQAASKCPQPWTKFFTQNKHSGIRLRQELILQQLYNKMSLIWSITVWFLLIINFTFFVSPLLI